MVLPLSAFATVHWCCIWTGLWFLWICSKPLAVVCQALHPIPISILFFWTMTSRACPNMVLPLLCFPLWHWLWRASGSFGFAADHLLPFVRHCIKHLPFFFGLTFLKACPNMVLPLCFRPLTLTLTGPCWLQPDCRSQEHPGLPRARQQCLVSLFGHCLIWALEKIENESWQFEYTSSMQCKSRRDLQNFSTF